MHTLYSKLRGVAEQHLEHPAIVEPGRVLRYGELLSAVAVLARRLRGAGVQHGSRVALLLPNGAEFVGSFFAVACVGSIAVPLNPSLTEPEIAALLKAAGVSAALTVADLRPRLVGALGAVDGLGEDAVISLDASVDGKPETRISPESARPDDPVLYLYSSGSTGRPKRIERSHFNLLYETERLTTALDLSPADRVLGVAPFSHVNGLVRSMVGSMLSGATLVPLAQFERRLVGRTIEEHAITAFIGVPFMFAMLAETRWPRPVDFSSLRHCISSSAPLRPDTSRRFHERYGLHVRQLYGTTETGTIALNLSPRIEELLDSVGLPLEGVQVDVFAEDGRALGPDEVGEIGIRSPAATTRYPGLPDETAASFRDGYFFPGDIGRKGAGGRIYLLGRKSLFINRGGYKVNPYEVETLIEQHPNVREAAVVGVDTEYGDQKIKALVVVDGPCEEREIIEFCREKLADFKIPSIVEFRAELPKSSTGKILRKAV